MSENIQGNLGLINQLFSAGKDILSGMNPEQRQPYETDINNLSNNLKEQVAQKTNTPLNNITRDFLFKYIANPENLKSLNLPIPPKLLELGFQAASKAGILDKLVGFATQSGNTELLSDLMSKSGDQGGVGDLLSGLVNNKGAADLVSGVLGNKDNIEKVANLFSGLGHHEE